MRNDNKYSSKEMHAVKRGAQKQPPFFFVSEEPMIQSLPSDPHPRFDLGGVSNSTEYYCVVVKSCTVVEVGFEDGWAVSTSSRDDSFRGSRNLE